jgi:hypothetical protein
MATGMDRQDETGETEKIRAMEEGKSCDTSQKSSTEQKGEEQPPESPSSKSWFSFGSKASLGMSKNLIP